MMDEGKLGPAMLALNERQRRFVWAYVTAGRNGQLSWKGEPDGLAAAREAGYAGSDETLRVNAHRLTHDAKVQAAIMETSQKEVNLAATTIATGVVSSIARNEKLPAKVRLVACGMLFDRGGMPKQTEHKVTVEHSVDLEDLDALALRLAMEIGVGPERLLGHGGKVIEGTAVNTTSQEQAPDDTLPF